MRRSLPALMLLSLAAMLHPSPAPAQAARSSADAPLQAIVVITADWDATDARIQRYQRASARGAWRRVGTPIAAVVGRTGLAWGRGAHGTALGDGPVKREGDGKAPAGVFTLGTAFGYAPAGQVPWIRLPYAASDASLKCVDDPRSRHYNRLVHADSIARPDWSSHEEMRRTDELYRLGIWVDHNVSPPEPGGGSCIFMHLWRSPGVPTIGCTAMARPDLEAVLRWLDPRARPVLVQAPRAGYDRVRASLALPPA